MRASTSVDGSGTSWNAGPNRGPKLSASLFAYGAGPAIAAVTMKLGSLTNVPGPIAA